MNSIDQIALVSEKVIRSSPRELRETIRNLGLRDALDGRRVRPSAFIDGFEGMDPQSLVVALRRQFFTRTRHLSPAAFNRARYFFQVQLVPYSIRDILAERPLKSIMFRPMAGRFPSSGFFPLEATQVVTVGMSRGRPNLAGVATDHFEIKTHVADFRDGEVLIGGAGLKAGQPFSRTTLSRDLSCEPGRSKDALPGRYADLLDDAIQCHEALELAAVDSTCWQSLPVFPRMSIAYNALDEIPFEDSPMLRRNATACIMSWMRTGCVPVDTTPAMQAWQKIAVQKIGSLSLDQIEDWTTLAGLLGPIDSAFILGYAAEKAVVEHDGRFLAPLGMLRAEDLTDKDVGDVYVNSREAQDRVQVVDAACKGRVGSVTWDFTSCEVGRELERD
jgi:hypothetical protein